MAGAHSNMGTMWLTWLTWKQCAALGKVVAILETVRRRLRAADFEEWVGGEIVRIGGGQI
jgi:hypothetical protein